MIATKRWRAIYVGICAGLLALLTAIFLAVPRSEDGIEWTKPMAEGGWMAWTFPVALFFFCIVALLTLFTVLALRYPETPRRGVLRLETTRGDRLFITLLGAAFINLGWLYFFGAPLTGALILCGVYALMVFRWV